MKGEIIKSNDNSKKLRDALQEVINFLEQTSEKYWANELRKIDKRLIDKEQREKALEDLDNYFGGMGSLNDLYFCEANENLPDGQSEKKVNAQLDKLLNVLYKKLSLLNASPITRAYWEWLEWRYRNEPPPRIKKTFRRK